MKSSTFTLEASLQSLHRVDDIVLFHGLRRAKLFAPLLAPYQVAEDIFVAIFEFRRLEWPFLLLNGFAGNLHHLLCGVHIRIMFERIFWLHDLVAHPYLASTFAPVATILRAPFGGGF